MASLLLFLALCSGSVELAAQSAPPPRYETLVSLFDDWRTFQKPPMVDGVPDYSPAAMIAQFNCLAEYRTCLRSIDTTGWPISARVDYLLLWAEMK